MSTNDTKRGDGDDERSKITGGQTRARAIDSTRKRFLQLMGTSMGTSLAGCGYGFVASNTSTPENPLALTMVESQKQFFRFCYELRASNALQARFIDDPSGTIASYGLIPPNSKMAFSRANKLVFYILANERLRNDFGAIAMASETTKHLAAYGHNAFTSDNPNLDVVRSITQKVISAPDYRGVLEDQLYILLSDAKFCELSGLNIPASERRAYANKLSYKVHDFRPVNPAIVILNANAIANANAIVNANAFGNVNVNVNVNANANANVNWNCNWNTAKGHCPPENTEVWYRFFDNLIEHAQAVNN